MLAWHPVEDGLYAAAVRNGLVADDASAQCEVTNEEAWALLTQLTTSTTT